MFRFLEKRTDLPGILAALPADATPGRDDLFRAFLPVEQVKVVILGQDPYPAPGVATGRAFEVGGLTRWDAPFRQISLKNILRLLYASATGADPYRATYRKILDEMAAGRFSLLSPDRLFVHWQGQGVLLLNTALTCRCNQPGAHAQLWEGFCADLIDYVEENAHPVWFLWGSHARQFEPRLGAVYASRHPMLCAEKWSDDFLKNPCFRSTWDAVHWLGTR